MIKPNIRTNMKFIDENTIDIIKIKNPKTVIIFPSNIWFINCILIR